MSNQSLSIIIPVWNEEKNIVPLVQRIDAVMRMHNINYEIIFVDDHSIDKTTTHILTCKKSYPVSLLEKKGKHGKAYSLIEGFAASQYETLCMIDGDLQYPPEVLPEMIEKIVNGADVVVANRKVTKNSLIRNALSHTFKNVFGKVLFGMQVDVQSGLKVFTKRVWKYASFTTTSAWTFDLGFLHRVKDLGFSLQSIDVPFEKRREGKSKVSLLHTGTELIKNAFSVWSSDVAPIHIIPDKTSMKGAGVFYKNRTYVTHTTLNHASSAIQTFLFKQKAVAFFVLALVGIGFIFAPLLTLQILVGILSTIYFIDVCFTFLLTIKSLKHQQEFAIKPAQLKSLEENDLPIYSILCPLYKEAHIIPNFLEAISKIDWPKDKLDVLLLLEEDDKGSIEKVARMNLPSYVQTIIVPHSFPKTKPKACNYGLLHAKGEYLVIYDAEDIPDPQQLKKAYMSFQMLPRNVVCLQAKLNYYNPSQNLLTKFFTAEYSLWFDITLPGFQSLRTSIPLGGTSNHFRTKDLLTLEGWDPFNVTEDADLGIRLFKRGWKTAIIDSTTLEEANSDLFNWIRQRSRWIKGYMQTYLVHTRHTVTVSKNAGIHSLLFHLVMGARITFLLINPFLWIVTLVYIVGQAYIGPYIQLLYTPFTYYTAIISLVIGNFLFFYYYLVGCAKRGQWDIMRSIFLIPLYWIVMSIAGFIAMYQLLFKPHYWEKTLHGLHLKPQMSLLKRLQALFGKNNLGAPTLIGASVLANFLNFVYNAYLSRNVSTEIFGLVGLMGSFVYLTQIPSGALSRTITHKSALLFGKYQEPIKHFWSRIRGKTWKYSFVLTALWIAAIPYLENFFHNASSLPYVLFTPILFVTLISAVDTGFLTGNQKFSLVAIIILLEASVKLALTMLFVSTGIPQFVYAAIPLSLLVTFGLSWSAASEIPKESVKIESTQQKLSGKFFTSSVVTKISAMLFLSLDVILARHFLTSNQAGEYVLLSLLGKVIYFFGSLISQFIIPYVSKAEGEKKHSHIVFYKLFGGMSLLTIGSFVIIGLLGPITAPVLFGSKTISILSYLPWYSASVLLFTLASTIISFHEMKHQYAFTFVSFVFSLILIGGISVFHSSIGNFVLVSFASSAVFFATTLNAHILSWNTNVRPMSNLKNIKELLQNKKSTPQVDVALHILVFNWRDTKHKWTGGAEVYVHELARRWAKMGCTVTMFAGNDGKSVRDEVLDGVQIYRRGGTYTVYIWAALYYIFKFKNQFDIVIDSENGLPFFTPLFVRVPKFLLIHHIHRDVFRTYLRFPFSRIAIFLESTVMPFVYRGQKVITVSHSSKNDILKLGFIQEKDITIVNPG